MDTQMTQESLDVLERLSGWTERFKFENSFFPQDVYTDLSSDGVMWLKNDHGAVVKRLEHMDIDGKLYVREP